ncbi:trypsin-like serine protease [Kitasatospora sp. NPDC098663]|uniref:trypsin-like serine protease n=1 Tax=Kitasatospora sp. NPDC098663 TaxID=3364096 RepID=UPI00380322D2
MRGSKLLYAAAVLALGTASIAVARGQASRQEPQLATRLQPAILLSADHHERYLQPIADEIHRLVDSGQVDRSGFTSIVFRPDDHALDLFWKGPVPTPVGAAVDAWRPGARAKARQDPVGPVSPEYDVRYRSAVYSKAEMEQAIGRFVAVVGNDVREWSTISPAADGSGLLLTYQPKATKRLAPAGSPVAAYEKRVEEIAGMPVHPEVGAVPVPTRGSRQSDAPPWTSGANLRVSGNGECSVGVPGWVSGKRVLLTAAHCQTSGNVYNGQRVVGEVTASDKALDVAVITTDQVPEARFYSGAWNSGDSRPLYGPARVDQGHSVCFSGATSGFHCELEVTHVGMSTSDGRTAVTEVRARNGGIAVAQGDSGGPAVANPQGDAMAPVGVIIAGDNGAKVTCLGTSSSTTCFSTGYFTPLDPIASKFGWSAL